MSYYRRLVIDKLYISLLAFSKPPKMRSVLAQVSVDAVDLGFLNNKVGVIHGLE